jgi:hypothetical protein
MPIDTLEVLILDPALQPEVAVNAAEFDFIELIFPGLQGEKGDPADVTEHEQAVDPHPQYLTVDELPAPLVTSVAGKTGAVTLAKEDVGLSNVDDTSDLDKPLSTAVLDAFADVGVEIADSLAQKADLTDLDNYQPLDNDLTEIAGLTTAAYGRSLLTQTDDDAARETLKAVGSEPTGITGASAVSNLVQLSKSDYDSLVTKDPNTLYIVLS